MLLPLFKYTFRTAHAASPVGCCISDCRAALVSAHPTPPPPLALLTAEFAAYGVQHCATFTGRVGVCVRCEHNHHMHRTPPNTDDMLRRQFANLYNAVAPLLPSQQNGCDNKTATSPFCWYQRGIYNLRWRRHTSYYAAATALPFNFS